MEGNDDKQSIPKKALSDLSRLNLVRYELEERKHYLRG